MLSKDTRDKIPAGLLIPGSYFVLTLHNNLMADGTELSNNLTVVISGGNSNSNDDVLGRNTPNALDLLFAKDQQTYDEFLSGFLYLNKGI